MLVGTNPLFSISCSVRTHLYNTDVKVILVSFHSPGKNENVPDKSNLSFNHPLTPNSLSQCDRLQVIPTCTDRKRRFKRLSAAAARMMQARPNPEAHVGARRAVT